MKKTYCRLSLVYTDLSSLLVTHQNQRRVLNSGQIQKGLFQEGESGFQIDAVGGQNNVDLVFGGIRR